MNNENCTLQSETVLTAAFMAMGYATASSLNPNGWGQLEVVSELADCAKRLEKLYASLPEEVRDSSPGVWAYEVAEPFGEWFGLAVGNGGVPSIAESDAQIAEMVTEFFTQCDGDDCEANKAALLATIQASFQQLHAN